ncbi:DUF397 domain-containing protein [Actinomadura madurae]|uniref:DUF397 domain-containing protein n=1 Tax=Actinomadura madurae TaxID=1993 RepID=UPI00399AA7DB
MTGSDLRNAIWRRSSFSSSQTQECVEVAAVWRKSSWTGSSGTDCVELASVDRLVAVRDSKDPEGPVLTFGARAWSAFLSTLKARG